MQEKLLLASCSGTTSLYVVYIIYGSTYSGARLGAIILINAHLLVSLRTICCAEQARLPDVITIADKINYQQTLFQRIPGCLLFGSVLYR